MGRLGRNLDVEQISQELDAAGGRLRVSEPTPGVRAAWRRAIDQARREARVPPGMRLRHTGRDRGDLVVWLEPEAPARPQPERLLVPEITRHWHPLLAPSLEQLEDRLDVDAASLQRAARLLNALLDAAEGRDLVATWATDEASAVVLDRDGDSETVRVFEEREFKEVVPTSDELDAAAPRYAWERVRTKTRQVPTGRLCFQVGGVKSWESRRRWSDRQRWRLEDKLGHVLAEVESRIEEIRQRRRRLEDQRDEREQAWRRAMARAREAFQDQRRREALLGQLNNWSIAGRVRDYCATLDTVAETSAHPAAREEVQTWVRWARDYADRIDPLRTGELAPTEVEPNPEDLRPFLGGWSPYGPHER